MIMSLFGEFICSQSSYYSNAFWSLYICGNQKDIAQLSPVSLFSSPLINQILQGLH